jgi:uncharacterized protein YhaN
MRLVRIEVGRFGRIDGYSLGDLSPELTVVCGPNEAGKSSLTALVRHVLYGFPTPGDTKEDPYVPASGGKRQARLVFADDDGEWVVERVEGPRGGSVTVHALSGPPRDGLVDELIRGVSRAAYRVVLGFGLSEMQQLDQLKGKDADLMSRLYAAGAGLTVSPTDVRAQLAERMDALWKSRGTTPAINQAKSDREAVRGEVRELENEADGLSADAGLLTDVEESLAQAKRARVDTQARAELLARTVSDSDRLMAESSAAAGRARDLAREAEEARTAAAAVAVDADALQVADAVRGLVAEAPAFGERLAALAEQRSRLLELEERIRASLDGAGWSEQQALAAAAADGVAAEIEAARAALDKLSARAELASEARDRGAAEVAGVDAGVNGAAVVARAFPLPAMVAAALGVAGLVAGLVLGQTPLTVFAGLVTIVGLALMFVRTPRGGAGADGDAVRFRAATAKAEAEAAQRAFEARAAAWSEQVRGWGLGAGGEQPAAVQARLQAAREVRAGDRERAGVREKIVSEEGRVALYVERVRAEVAPLLGEDPAAVTPERRAELVGRASARVESAAEAGRTRGEAIALADRLGGEAEAELKRSAEFAASASAGLAAAGVVEGGPEEARRLESGARIEADDALNVFGSLTDEAATLRTRIAAASREDRLVVLRLEEEALTERIAAAAQEYEVLALASRLLSRAQDLYERERQPDVVKRAEAAFSRMTNGRYPRIAIPLGTNDIEVFDASGAAIAPDKLSRGTVEQLYLALRIGLVDQLGEVGAGLPVLMDDVLVNMDPDRLRPAAEAVADLADRRQVVFLTCHPAMADLLCSVAPHAARIELGGPSASQR